ncbi:MULTISPECIES: uracil-DNA glycosylase family protein [Microvirga]|uniref:uracil-DNA glycosylase family protein n=1 Tax=Microvirga TaxID=186650 RepID=UPI0021C9649F|nr:MULTISPECIES: uracil-DNA glycosylase family protein [unclassified Microvirga]
MRSYLPPGTQAGPISPQLPTSSWNGLAIIGEAPGRQEIINGVPFTGPAGDLLNKVLERVGINRDETLITNCFAHQPAWSANQDGKRRNNDILNFFTLDQTIANPNLPSYRGRYLLEDLAADLRATWRLLREMKPKAILAMGSTALWGIAHLEGLTENRGQTLSTRACDAPLIPTFHPAFVLHRKDDALIDRIEEDMRKVLPLL